MACPASVPKPALTAWRSFGGGVRRIGRALISGLDWAFGLFSLVIGLSLLSVAPLVNFLSLGYLIHASGRVAATGRLRDGFVGIRKASVAGSFVLGTWIVSRPVRLVSSLWTDAELIAPGSSKARWWHMGLVALTSLAVLHIVWASLRGGRLWHFLWPQPIRLARWLRQTGKVAALRRAVENYLGGLRLPYYFWLGARGFCGALLWLAVPAGLLIIGAQLPVGKGGGLLSFLGILLLMPVAVHLPFLQAHFGMQNRFGSLFDIGEIRRSFNRAPLAFLLSLHVTLLFAVPLYLLKIELPPRELAWLPSLVFVVFIFPARLLVGWAVGRARTREQPRHWFFRWTSRFAAAPLALFYAIVVFTTQYLSWNGAGDLLEQHAFMTPAPLMTL